MAAKLKFVSIMILACTMLACGSDLTSEDHLNNAKTYLEALDADSAVVELKYALTKDVNNTRARAVLGRVYFERGAYEDAEKELSRALESGVDTSAVVPVLAEVLLGLGDYEQLDTLPLDGLEPMDRSTVQAAKGLAMLFRENLTAATEIVDTALQNEPSSSFAQVAAARLLMATGAYDEAREQLQAIFVTDPKYAPAWNLLGDIESAQREPRKAERAYSQVIKLSVYSFDAILNRAMMRIYLRNWKGAQKDLAHLMRGYPQARIHPGVHFAWGIVQLQVRQIDQAEKSFEQASEFSNAYPLTFYYLAAINLEKGLIQQAISNIYRFLGLVHDSVVGAKLAARLELEQHGYSKAEELLLPIVAEHPNDLEALNLLASALLAQGKSGEGVELLSRVAELQPESAEAKARLGAGFLVAGSDELGIATLQNILAQYPGYEQADILIVLNYLRQKDFEGAIRSAKEYRERNPASATSYNLLGRAYLANNEPEKARQAFYKALELRPGDPGASHSLAEFDLAEKRYKEARKQYQQVLQYNPDNMPTLMKIAASYAQEGKEQEMVASLQSTIASHPRAVEPRLIQARFFIAKGELEKAAPLFDELTPEQKAQPDTLVTMAGFQIAAGRYNQALRSLDELMKLRPDVSHYHYMKSKAYAGLGEMVKFTAELERSVELDPNHFYAKIALARLTLLSRNTELLEERLEELKEMAPDNPDVMKLDAAAAQARGDNAYALQLLETVVTQSPTSSNAIALAAQLQSMGDVDGAIVQLQKWIEGHSADVVVREKLAELYSSVNRVGGAIYQYRQILKVEPNHVVALNNVAWYLQEDDPVQALSLAEKAYALSPNSASILDTLAMTQMRTNNLVEARRSIDRALALAPPNSPEMYFHEAQIRAREGDRDGAVKTVIALLDENKKFPERDRAEAFVKKLQM